MKYINKIAAGFLFFTVMISCVDDTTLDFDVTKPASIESMEYLNAYETLKSYVDRSANPNFKLGSGVMASTYNEKGMTYRLVNSNFDEIVAGYEMKHGAVVRVDGTLNLATVESFLANAEAAGVAVYGHTLVWHANQNATYLNNIIADEVIASPTWDEIAKADFETDDASNYEYNENAIVSFTANGEGSGGTGRAIAIKNESVRENDYNSQFFLKFSPAMEEGDMYEFSIDIRADDVVSFGTQAHVIPYAYKHWDFFGNIGATTEWQTFSKQIIVSAEVATTGTIAFNLGNNATTYYFDNLSLKKYNPAGGGSGGGSGGYALYVNNPSKTDGYWGVQSLYQMSGVEEGVTYELDLMVKGDANGVIRPELQSSDYSSNGFGSIAVTTEWANHTLTVEAGRSDRDRFIISYGEFAGSLWIDNVSIRKVNSNGTKGESLIANGDFENGSSSGWGGWGNSVTIRLSLEGEGYVAGGSVIQKTPEEKKEIISNAMETWIAGIMEVSKYVKAWDVVNEPMSDWPDPSKLKTGIGKVDMAADEFYWQDYMGKDFAVDAFQLARKYGNPGDILFINDYGLESESQAKCKGLIEYVKYIEERGAKVDGIGTQMHVTCNETKIEAIREMFKNLAATGKLIKVSELDMGYRVAGTSTNVKTVYMTEEQHKEMSAFYEAILHAYFELVPAPQRYGITHWSPTDSPDNSSWRGGEPIGLWSLDYNRKHTFGGYANGLAGKKVSE